MEQPTRPEFWCISQTGQIIFYALAALTILLLASFVWLRVRVWRRARPVAWSVRLSWRRVWAVVMDLLFQRRVVRSRWGFGAPMHLLLFAGFVILLIGTTLLAIHHWAPPGLKFHHGTYYLVYEVALDAFGAVFVAGVLLAIGRRYLSRPASLGNDPTDIWLLGSLLVLGVTGFLLEAARIQMVPKPFDIYSPVGLALSHVIPAFSGQGYRVLWWLHSAFVFAFLLTLPFTRVRHIVYAIVSTYMQPDRPMGALAKMGIEEFEKTGKIGAVEPFDYDRYQLASVDACMECGRCTDVCPAHAVGKTLDPQRIVQNLRSAAVGAKPVAEALTEDALWACTTCSACVRECPVNIRQVDLIVDARRALVAEGRFAGAGANALRQVNSTMNPWGTTDREEWMKGQDVPLVREAVGFDVLLWIGCAGAVDKGAQKTNRALVKLLKQAGVSFACLGNDEVCTGDPARRMGDEFLFQAMAETNIELFKTHSVTTIVTSCPHCYNTFRNEYPQFGARFQVFHHSEFLARLLAEGKLTAPKRDEKVAWHDPCYLARVNDQVDAPRSVLRAALDGNLAEPKGGKGRKTLCCGAGGGRMWMEEAADQRPGNRRAEQLLATGAKTIAVGCPFCRIMIGDSVAAVTDEEISIVDLAELLVPPDA
jgi:Fe-S oxidoreductase